MKILGGWAVFLLILFAGWGTGLAQAASPITGNNHSKSILPDTIRPNSNLSLNAPGNLVAESPQVGKVILHWTDNSNNESGFKIERTSGGDGSFFEIDYVSADTTSYEQSELSTYAVFPGETYRYRVKAFNAARDSDYSNEDEVTVMAEIASPTPPAALRAKAMWADGRFVVRLFWGDTADNEQQYVVQRSKPGQGYIVVGNLPANSFKFEEDATHMERNIKYTYRVIAYNAGGAGVSNTAEVFLPASTPAAPSFNAPQNQGSTSLLLSWQDKSDNEDGFKITRYGEKPTNPLWGTKPADQEYMLSPGETSLLVTGLQPGTLYSFELSAYNALGHSGLAQTQSFTGPPAPTSLSVQSISPNENKLTWASLSNDSGFSIERKKSGGSYAEVATVEAQARSYSDPLLLPGTQYVYRVRSWIQSPYDNSRIWSDYSNQMGITTPGQTTSNLQSNGNQTGPSAMKTVVTFTLGQKSYQVDGATRQMESAAVSLEGRTMLPVKYLAESLGAQLGWDAEARQVTLSQADKVIELTIGKNTALVNGQPVPIDAANPAVVPVISAEGRTLLPLGFISANLGCTVEWDPLTQSIAVGIQ